MKMTIHRALAELKLIDAKIEKQINDFIPCGFYQKGKLINGFVTAEEFQRRAQSGYDSVNDLINRKNQIKSAIVAANGITLVTIAGKEMTIADAINFKTVVKFRKGLITRMKAILRDAVAQVNKNNATINDNCQKLLEVTFGKENVKAGKDDLDAVRKPYMESNEFHLFDPLDAQAKIDSMENEVSEFEAEVDAALSEINAVTFIEI